MLAKSWKRIGLIILIIACLWNITSKLVGILSFDRAINQVKSYIHTNKSNEEKSSDSDKE